MRLRRARNHPAGAPNSRNHLQRPSCCASRRTRHTLNRSLVTSGGAVTSTTPTSPGSPNHSWAATQCARGHVFSGVQLDRMGMRPHVRAGPGEARGWPRTSAKRRQSRGGCTRRVDAETIRRNYYSRENATTLPTPAGTAVDTHVHPVTRSDVIGHVTKIDSCRNSCDRLGHVSS